MTIWCFGVVIVSLLIPGVNLLVDYYVLSTIDTTNDIYHHHATKPLPYPRPYSHDTPRPVEPAMTRPCGGTTQYHTPSPPYAPGPMTRAYLTATAIRLQLVCANPRGYLTATAIRLYVCAIILVWIAFAINFGLD